MTSTVTLPTTPEPYLGTGLLPADFYSYEGLLSDSEREKIVRVRDFFRTEVAPIVDGYWARKASKEHLDHVERMQALQRAKKERAGAQARKVVPSCGRIPMFGDSWWTVRIDNASSAMATILGVAVTALDANGFELPGGYRQANDGVPFDQAFERAVSVARSEPRNDLVPAFKEAVRDALAGHLVRQWPRTLAPNHYAVMAYTTADPTYELRITLDYEDEAGYRWRRTDSCRPRRMDE